jgi:acetylornithine deacetylase/succinyl-diaminopimelate desuccinylase-like protein
LAPAGGALLSSDDYGSSVERTAKLHPAWTRPLTEGRPLRSRQRWSSDPWTPARKDDGRLYGRGIADDKSGLVIHAGTLKVFDGSPPCHLKLIVEGMEETNSNLDAFVRAHPDLFQCDVFIVADWGTSRSGSRP